MDAEFLDSDPYVCGKHFITWAITTVPKLPTPFFGIYPMETQILCVCVGGGIEYWQMPEYSYTYVITTN